MVDKPGGVGSHTLEPIEHLPVERLATNGRQLAFDGPSGQFMAEPDPLGIEAEYPGCLDLAQDVIGSGEQ